MSRSRTRWRWGWDFWQFFWGTLLVGAFVSFIVRKFLQTVGLQWFDRILGGVFGLLRGVLVDAVILMVLVAFAIKPEAVRGSVHWRRTSPPGRAVTPSSCRKS